MPYKTGLLSLYANQVICLLPEHFHNYILDAPCLSKEKPTTCLFAHDYQSQLEISITGTESNQGIAPYCLYGVAQQQTLTDKKSFRNQLTGQISTHTCLTRPVVMPAKNSHAFIPPKILMNPRPGCLAA